MELINTNNYPFGYNLIDSFFNEYPFKKSMNKSTPSVNILETETNFIIKLAAPGLKKEDFDIDQDNNLLTISAKKEENKEIAENAEDCKYTRVEFNYNEFERSFTLPNSINKEEIFATYENGILEIKINKKKEAITKPKRKIDII